ncbi:Uncharacterized protein LW93_8232 [Fusarium fujikuroi]|nr:Uncharacterized protein LW93_8232 [Fusarium fujikuroi]
MHQNLTHGVLTPLSTHEMAIVAGLKLRCLSLALRLMQDHITDFSIWRPSSSIVFFSFHSYGAYLSPVHERLCYSGFPDWSPLRQEHGHAPTSTYSRCPFPASLRYLLDFSSSTHSSSSSIFSPAFFTLDLLHRFLPSFHFSNRVHQATPL